MNFLIKLRGGYVVPWVMWQQTLGIGHILMVNRLAWGFLELLVDSFLSLNFGRTRITSAETLPGAMLAYIEQRAMGFSAGLHCWAFTLLNIFQFFIFLVAAMNMPLCGPSFCDFATESYVQYETLLWNIAWPLSLYPIMRWIPVQCEHIFLHSISLCVVFIFPSATYCGEYRNFVGMGICGSVDSVHREVAYNVGFLLLQVLYEADGIGQSGSCIRLILNVRMHVSCNATMATCIVSMAAHASITRTRVLIAYGLFITLHAYVLNELGLANVLQFAAVLKSLNADVNSSHSTGEQLKFYYMLLNMLTTIVLYLWTCCDRFGFVVIVLNSPSSSSLLYTNLLQHTEAVTVWSYHQFLHLQCEWLYEAMVAVINKSLVIHKAASVQCTAPILILHEVIVLTFRGAGVLPESLAVLIFVLAAANSVYFSFFYHCCAATVWRMCRVCSQCCTSVTHYVYSTPNMSTALRGHTSIMS